MGREEFNKIVWENLNNIREELAGLSMGDIREFVKKNKDDVEKLKNEFLETFKEVPVDDPLRLEYLITLGEMGIILYK